MVEKNFNYDDDDDNMHKPESALENETRNSEIQIDQSPVGFCISTER